MRYAMIGFIIIIVVLVCGMWIEDANEINRIAQRRIKHGILEPHSTDEKQQQ